MHGRIFDGVEVGITISPHGVEDAVFVVDDPDEEAG
jgi:hypothetical protein